LSSCKKRSMAFWTITIKPSNGRCIMFQWTKRGVSDLQSSCRNGSLKIITGTMLSSLRRWPLLRGWSGTRVCVLPRDRRHLSMRASSMARWLRTGSTKRSGCPLVLRKAKLKRMRPPVGNNLQRRSIFSRKKPIRFLIRRRQRNAQNSKNNG
jgi:hypothetical protein